MPESTRSSREGTKSSDQITRCKLGKNEDGVEQHVDKKEQS